MKNQFNLSIKTPCSENFSNFKPTKNGGFCQSCTKEVIDFSKMSTNQIANHFKNNGTKNTCGQFKSSQLTAYNIKPKKNKRISFISAIGLACLSFFSLTIAKAQSKITNTAPSKNTIQQNENNITVKGIITDENLEPIPGVNITIKGSDKGTITNFDGEFMFSEKLKKGTILLISYIGYGNREAVVHTDNLEKTAHLNISLSEIEEFVLMGKVAVKETYKSCKK